MSSKYDITIDQGATFEMTLNVKDSNGNALNLSGYSARMQIRPSYASSNATVSVSTSTSGITISPNTGTVYVAISAATTSAITIDRNNGKPPRGVFVYDLKIEDTNGKVTRLIYGDATVYGEVTR